MTDGNERSAAAELDASGIDPANKRYGLRLRKFIDIVVEDPFSAMLFRGAIADISPTGMRAIVDQYLAVGSKYTITMKRNPFLRMRGQVRWIRASGTETFQVGVEFIDVVAEDAKRLTTFLEIERQRMTNG